MSGRVTMICSTMLWPPKRAATREFWSDHQAVTRRSRYARSSVAITRRRRFRVLRIVRLTVKLRGRPPRPEGRHGRTLSTGARGAKPLTPHGPLQRLLGGSDVPSVWLPKLYANILGTVRLLARHDCLYPFLSGLVTESKRLEVGDGRDSRITDAVRPRA